MDFLWDNSRLKYYVLLPPKSLKYPGYSHLHHEKYIFSTLKWNKNYLSEYVLIFCPGNMVIV